MRCPRCKRGIKIPPTGRPPRYCSVACKQAAYRKRQRQSVHFSTGNCEWATPPDLFKQLDLEFGPFTLDVCATPDNAKCPTYFTRRQDGLRQRWTGRVWCNPPYGRSIGLWISKAWDAVQGGGADLAVCLVPARTDTRWWHEFASKGDCRFLPGRVRFGGGKNSAPFPSAVVVFRNANEGVLALRNYGTDPDQMTA